MKTTKNLGLNMPDEDDFVEIGKINENTAKIDEELAKLATLSVDVDATNAAINRLNHITEVTLTAAGWTGSAAPYEQTVNVSGATEEQEAILVSALADGASEATQKAYAKAFGIISQGTGTIGNGTATFKVYKKPATDITVGLKGV